MVNKLFSILFFLLFVIPQISAQPFTIRGITDDIDSGYIILTYRDIEYKKDSIIAKVKNGRFEFNGNVNVIDVAFLVTYSFKLGEGERCSSLLFIEPGISNIEIEQCRIKNEKYGRLNVQNEYDFFMKSQDRLYARRREGSHQLKSIENLFKRGMIDTKSYLQKKQKLIKKYSPVWDSIQNSELRYIESHPDSHLSLFLVKNLIGRISNDSILNMYSSLSGKVKGSTLDIGFNTYFMRYRIALSEEYAFDKLMPNEMAPYFEIQNDELQPKKTIYDYRGNMVLLVFWSLYCSPCLIENVFIEDLREKNKNLIVIANCDILRKENYNELRQYIIDNKYDKWINVIDTGFLQKGDIFFSGNFKDYYGLGVPRTVLIDKKGKILYKHYGYSKEEMDKLKDIIEKAINQ
ncbi:MAG: AhpC/TSA family protein [Flavobacteriaceae bacterium]|nr:AhpC/TSA family protein [Flavobacteriaceae bacterium]